MHVTVYDTGHTTSEIVCGAFAEGCGAPIKSVEEHQGDTGAAFLYGVLRGGMDLYRDCLHYGRPFLFCDNGYIGAHQFDGYYRVTWNRRFHNGIGEPDRVRLEALDIKVKPWRKTGKNIVICPQLEWYDHEWMFHGNRWLRIVQKILRRVSKRPRLVTYAPADSRCPPKQPPLRDLLEDAWALVTHESNAATEALIAGVPVFVTGEGSARTMGLRDLTKIETPAYPGNREEWLATLAANQWTLEEMRQGVAARALGIVQ